MNERRSIEDDGDKELRYEIIKEYNLNEKPKNDLLGEEVIKEIEKERWEDLGEYGIW